MKRIILILMTAGLFFGCKPGIPSDIIDADKMKKVLYDIHLADGYISTIPTVDSAKKTGAAYYNGIYQKFEIDSAIYNKSMDYYYNHPEKLSLMYKAIDKEIKNQIMVIQKSDSLKNDKVVKAQLLDLERVADSIAVNQSYGFDYATTALYLERYKDIYSKNAVIFNLLKIEKEKTENKKSVDKTKTVTDSLKADKNKLDLKKIVQPVDTPPIQ